MIGNHKDVMEGAKPAGTTGKTGARKAATDSKNGADGAAKGQATE
jgi:hypothetical protein